jgi:hypothetical protein
VIAGPCAQRFHTLLRLVKTSPTKNAFRSVGIWRVAWAERSWPMAGIRWVMVMELSAIHSARRPGVPMSSAVGTCSWAPKKKGVNTVDVGVII